VVDVFFCCLETFRCHVFVCEGVGVFVIWFVEMVGEGSNL